MQQPIDPLYQTLRQQLQAEEYVVWWALPDSRRRAKQSWLRTLPALRWGTRLLVALLLFGSVLLTNLAHRGDLSTYSLIMWPAFWVALLLVAGSAVFVFSMLRARYRLRHTIYGITNQRLLVMTIEHGQVVLNAYSPGDLGRIDIVVRQDGWGDILILGSQRLQRVGYSLNTVTSRLAGVAEVRAVAEKLTRLRDSQNAASSGINTMPNKGAGFRSRDSRHC